METIILDIIKKAEVNKDYELLYYVKKMLDEFARTVNCPLSWKEMGATIASLYNTESWIYEELELWNHVD